MHFVDARDGAAGLSFGGVQQDAGHVGVLSALVVFVDGDAAPGGGGGATGAQGAAAAQRAEAGRAAGGGHGRGWGAVRACSIASRPARPAACALVGGVCDGVVAYPAAASGLPAQSGVERYGDVVAGFAVGFARSARGLADRADCVCGPSDCREVVVVGGGVGGEQQRQRLERLIRVQARQPKQRWQRRRTRAAA